MKQTAFHGSSKGSPCFLTGKAHLEKQQSGRFWHGCHCKRSPSSLGFVGELHGGVFGCF